MADNLHAMEAYALPLFRAGHIPIVGVVGAFLGDALVGVAGCMQEPKRKSRHKAVVWGTYVAPTVRRRGVGRRLLEHLILEARAWPSVERLTLAVVEWAVAARRLYVAIGFETFGLE
jgi:GNAT superfamily N-acetyltransferase